MFLTDLERNNVLHSGRAISGREERAVWRHAAVVRKSCTTVPRTLWISFVLLSYFRRARGPTTRLVRCAKDKQLVGAGVVQENLGRPRAS